MCYEKQRPICKKGNGERRKETREGMKMLFSLENIILFALSKCYSKHEGNFHQKSIYSLSFTGWFNEKVKREMYLCLEILNTFLKEKFF